MTFLKLLVKMCLYSALHRTAFVRSNKHGYSKFSWDSLTCNWQWTAFLELLDPMTFLDFRPFKLLKFSLIHVSLSDLRWRNQMTNQLHSGEVPHLRQARVIINKYAEIVFFLKVKLKNKGSLYTNPLSIKVGTLSKNAIKKIKKTVICEITYLTEKSTEKTFSVFSLRNQIVCCKYLQTKECDACNTQKLGQKQNKTKTRLQVTLLAV